MSLHAFVDESRRNNTYLLAAAVVLPRELTKLRKLLAGMRMPNQRELHFKKETPARRKEILSALVRTSVQVHLYLACCRKGEERARQVCVARLTGDLLDVGANRLVLDSREARDEHDLLTIRTSLGKYARHRTRLRAPAQRGRRVVVDSGHRRVVLRSRRRLASPGSAVDEQGDRPEVALESAKHGGRPSGRAPCSLLRLTGRS
ncbi:hypothetical protein [Lentzea sp. NPDC003310]|uniref:hypothetical protein n=1 Tax=Lentzea sp. NPDC003310 TaxID=3154447 RepID=UPI0033AEDA89